MYVSSVSAPSSVCPGTNRPKKSQGQKCFCWAASGRVGWVPIPDTSGSAQDPDSFRLPIPTLLLVGWWLLVRGLLQGGGDALSASCYASLVSLPIRPREGASRASSGFPSQRKASVVLRPGEPLTSRESRHRRLCWARSSRGREDLDVSRRDSCGTLATAPQHTTT